MEAAGTLPGGSELKPEGAPARERETGSIEIRQQQVAGRRAYDPAAREAPFQPRARRPAGHSALVFATVLGDLASVAIGTLATSTLRYPIAETFSSLLTPEGSTLVLLASLAWVGLLSARGAYWPKVTLGRGRQAVVIVGAGLPAWIVVQLAASWLKVTVPLDSRLVMALSLPATLLGLVLFRLSIVRLGAHQVYRRRGQGLLLALSASDPFARGASSPWAPHFRGRVVVHQYLGPLSPGRAQSLVAEYEAEEVLLETGVLPGADTLQIAFACLDAGAEVQLVPAEGRASGRGLSEDRVGALPMLHLRRFDLAGPEVIFKRMADVVGSTLGLLLLSPLFAALALAVKINSSGPVIYTSERIGKRGRRFRMFKFRTMFHGNDSREYEKYLGSLSGREDRRLSRRTGRTSTSRPHDPRVTAVGAWLRRLSLDELPQLLQHPSWQNEPRRSSAVPAV